MKGAGTEGLVVGEQDVKTVIDAKLRENNVKTCWDCFQIA